MASDPLFGWDLTFKTVEKDIKRKSDIIVAFIHWNLIKRGFRNIGIGDEVSSCFFIYILIYFFLILNILVFYLLPSVQETVLSKHTLSLFFTSLCLF